MNPVICTWAIELPAGADLVWPDGCRDVIAIMPQGQPATLLLSGVDDTARRIHCHSTTRFMGIRLAPGVRFPWESTTPEALRTDTPLHRPEHHEQQGIPATPQAMLHALQQQVNNSAIIPPAWISDYLTELGEHSTRLSPQKPLPHWPRSERTIRRLLTEHTGMPPRYWQQLARIRTVARAIAATDEPLAALAADYHFADQAHLSRDIRRWLGCTPAMLRSDNTGNQHQRAIHLAKLSAPDAFSRT